jgi:hypothetical protein
MASLSPVLHVNRPGTFVDPHRQAEYPIFLGDSLRNVSAAKTQYFNVHYNWKPKNLSSKQKAVITRADPQPGADAAYQLTIQEPAVESKPFKYLGNLRTDLAQNGSTKSSPEDQTTSLALVFNQEKSAFVLEKISAALDFNISSAPGQSRADVRARPQLPSGKKSEETLPIGDKATASLSDDDEAPDAANPYDYRHFLEEAKANAEKGLGSRTPIPGGLSGFPSPVPGPSRFTTSSGPGTPLHKPVTSAPSAQLKKRKNADEPSHGTTQKATTTKPKQKPSRSTATTSASKPKPLSKERISDSDEEIGDTITLSRPSHANSTSTTRSRKPNAATAQPKSGYAPSARIEVDEAADLVIDMGSPPPATRRRGPGVGFASPFAIARTQPPHPPSPPRRKGKSAAMYGTSILDSEEEAEEEEEEDAEGEPDDDADILLHDVNVDAHPGRPGGEGEGEEDDDADADADEEVDADGDVDDLVLGSPRASTTRAPSVSVSQMDVDQDEDENEELAAELEAVLENDDEDGDGGVSGTGGGGVGLGISTGGGGPAVGYGGEEESEVSEEE